MDLILRNPHAVLAAIAARPGDVRRVELAPGTPSPGWAAVAEAAEAAGITVTRARPDRHDRPGGGGRGERGGRPPRGGRPGGAGRGDRRGARGPGAGPRGRDDRRDEPKQGREGAASALVAPRAPVPLETLFAEAGGRGLWLALDQVQDPRNVGSVFRSAAFYAVRGAVLTSDRSAPLSGVAYDAASGGLESVPFAVVPNLARALAAAKHAGLWVLGCSEDGDRPVSAVDRERAWLVVFGGEQRGLRRLTRESCDETCRLDPLGPVGTLNVAVAAAVTLSWLAAATPATGHPPATPAPDPDTGPGR